MTHDISAKQDDVYWMRKALEQAQMAFDADEVPVGAVLVQGNKIIAASHNAPIRENDPSAHAEVRVLREAGRILENYRLTGCTLYVTLEPCAMCAMALLHARVDRVVFGARDAKTGAAGSILNLFDMKELNHQTSIEEGVLADACSEILKAFFAKRRKKSIFPLRDDALRTPEERFANAGVMSEGTYEQQLPALDGLRLHYQFYAGESEPLVLCLHDAVGYSQQFVEAMGLLRELGHGVLVPDLIGFGRSDKPKKQHWHTVQAHAHYLVELVCEVIKKHAVGDDALEDKELLIVTSNECLGLCHLVVKLCSAAGVLVRTICVVESLPILTAVMRDAPFPDQGYRSALRAFSAWGQYQKEEGLSTPYKRVKVLTFNVWLDVLRRDVLS